MGLIVQKFGGSSVRDRERLLRAMRIVRRTWEQGDDVVVVLNLSTEPRESYEIGMPTGGLWKLRLNTDARTYSKAFGDYASYDVDASEPGMDGFGAHASINIAPYTMLVYSQDH